MTDHPFPSERISFAQRKLEEANDGEDHTPRVLLDELLPESHLTLRPPAAGEVSPEGYIS